MTDTVLNLSVLILDTLTAGLIVWLLLTHKCLQTAMLSHRFGLWIGACGLLGQAMRNLVFLLTGLSPNDNELPLWILKDAGYWVIVLTILYHLVTAKNGTKSNEATGQSNQS